MFVSLYSNKRWLLLPLDCTLVVFAFYISWVLRFENFYPPAWLAFPGWDEYFKLIGLQLLSALVAFIFTGIYRNVWMYASLHDMYQILKATFLAFLLFSGIVWLYNRMENLPRSIIVFEYIVLFLLLSFRSFSWRMAREFLNSYRKKDKKRTLLIGAGRAGNHLVRELLSGRLDYLPVAFLDDDPRHAHSYIQGIPIVGNLVKLAEVIDTYNIQQVILTETLGSVDVRSIYHSCEKRGINCKTLPPLDKFLQGQQEVEQSLRTLEIEDLLGRDTVKIETESIHKMLQGKVVLITGAGGSIGSELCRQLLNYDTKALVLLEISENALYEIDYELRYTSMKSPLPLICAVVGDIKDETMLQRMFHENDIDIVFHCAAYKHVPLLELNPEQAIMNNLIGTIKLAQTARSNSVERFIMLSTDKAVNPANVMGATKRMAELYIQNLGRSCSTRFLTVRFGNVLGSKGSVVPLFSKQIEAGGPITVTHPDITRYFMTISEAVGLVLQAGVIGKGSDILILDMGQPVKIKELAEDMIRLANLSPHKDISIQYIGLRPGEKLSEELFFVEENRKPTKHKKIYIATGRNVSLDTLTQRVEGLVNILAKKDRAELDNAIASIIPEYRPVHRPYLQKTQFSLSASMQRT